MPNRWTDWVKDFASKNNLTYGCAMSKQECKDGYATKYPKQAKKGKAKAKALSASFEPLEIAEPTKSDKVSPKIAIKQRSNADLQKDYIDLLKSGKADHTMRKKIFDFIENVLDKKDPLRQPLYRAYNEVVREKKKAKKETEQMGKEDKKDKKPKGEAAYKVFTNPDLLKKIGSFQASNLTKQKQEELQNIFNKNYFYSDLLEYVYSNKLGADIKKKYINKAYSVDNKIEKIWTKIENIFNRNKIPMTFEKLENNYKKDKKNRRVKKDDLDTIGLIEGYVQQERSAFESDENPDDWVLDEYDFNNKIKEIEESIKTDEKTLKTIDKTEKSSGKGLRESINGEGNFLKTKKQVADEAKAKRDRLIQELSATPIKGKKPRKKRFNEFRKVMPMASQEPNLDDIAEVEGEGFFSDLRYGRNDYNPKVRDLLAKIGSKKIKTIELGRDPVIPALTKVLDVISGGKFGERVKKDFDDLYHLFMVITLDDGQKIMIEKNEVIVISKAIPSRTDKAQYKMVTNVKPITITEMLDKAKARMGDKYFKYSAKDNNCQDYLMAILQANGMGDQSDYAFIKQDTKKLFKDLPFTRKFANTVTDFAGRLDVLFSGSGVNKTNSQNKISTNTIKKMPKFAKGSQEAKDFMASIRAKRGSKGAGLGAGLGAGMCQSDCCEMCGGKLDIGKAFRDFGKKVIGKKATREVEEFGKKAGKYITKKKGGLATDLIDYGVPAATAAVLGGIGSLGGPVTGVVGSAAGSKLGKEVIAKELHKATGAGVKGRFAKGSQAAKDHMAKIRAMRKK